MEITTDFKIPMEPEAAFDLLLDPKRIVGNVPGAELLESKSDTVHRGQIRVRLGPVAMVFKGEMEIVDIDPATRTARIVGKGTDTKGRGRASADAVMKVDPAPEGAQTMLVCQVNLAGAAAQYGRAQGVISALAEEITRQFAANLAKSISEGGDGASLQGPRAMSGSRVVAGAAMRAVGRRVGLARKGDVA